MTDYRGPVAATSRVVSGGRFRRASLPAERRSTHYRGCPATPAAIGTDDRQLETRPTRSLLRADRFLDEVVNHRRAAANRLLIAVRKLPACPSEGDASKMPAADSGVIPTTDSPRFTRDTAQVGFTKPGALPAVRCADFVFDIDTQGPTATRHCESTTLRNDSQCLFNRHYVEPRTRPGISAFASRCPWNSQQCPARSPPRRCIANRSTGMTRHPSPVGVSALNTGVSGAYGSQNIENTTNEPRSGGKLHS